jgi:hypothetical protein
VKKQFWQAAARNDNFSSVQEQTGQIKWVVLDAMGVIYRHGDDVTAHVIPFLSVIL